MPEKALVAQALYALQCVPGDVYASTDGDGSCVEVAPLPAGLLWSTHNLAGPAVASLLARFAGTSKILQRVAAFAQDCCGAFPSDTSKATCEPPRVLAAFGEWLLGCVAAWQRQAVLMLRDCNAQCGPTTLLALEARIVHNESLLQFLADLCEKCERPAGVDFSNASPARSRAVIDALVSSHVFYECSGSSTGSDLCEMSWRGLVAALSAYLRCADGWMLDGQLFDAAGEFPFGQPSTTQETDTEALHFPDILAPVARELVNAGRSVFILRESALSRGMVSRFCEPTPSMRTDCFSSLNHVDDVFAGLDTPGWKPFLTSEDCASTGSRVTTNGAAASLVPRYMQLEHRVHTFIRQR